MISARLLLNGVSQLGAEEHTWNKFGPCLFVVIAGLAKDVVDQCILQKIFPVKYEEVTYFNRILAIYYVNMALRQTILEQVKVFKTLAFLIQSFVDSAGQTEDGHQLDVENKNSANTEKASAGT